MGRNDAIHLNLLLDFTTIYYEYASSSRRPLNSPNVRPLLSNTVDHRGCMNSANVHRLTSRLSLATTQCGVASSAPPDIRSRASPT